MTLAVIAVIDLFPNIDLLMYSFLCMIISPLSDVISMCKIKKNSYFQTRPERRIYVDMKD